MAVRDKKIAGGKLIPVYLAKAWHEDDSDGSLRVVDHILNDIHDGSVWYIELYSGSLADDGTLILAGIMPSNRVMHFTFAGACGGLATIELIEGCTFSASGTARNPFNMNRYIGDAGGLQCYENPTLAGGTVLQQMLLPGGSGPFAGGAHIGTRLGLEWITNTSEVYAVRLTNVSGGATPGWVGVNFHDEEV